MTTLALAGYAVFLVLAFGLRSLVHWRQTGTTGFVGITEPVGSVGWTGGVLFVAALVVAAAAPILQSAGAVAPAVALDTPACHLAGVALYALGLAGTLWAQLAMGTSWRVGVDPSATTALVERGPFRWVRNPIYTAMTLATVGLALIVPNAIAALALVTLLVALEIHVRLVEEPYLARVHGERYRRYVATTGRFVPGVGRRVGPT